MKSLAGLVKIQRPLLMTCRIKTVTTSLGAYDREFYCLHQTQRHVLSQSADILMQERQDSRRPAKLLESIEPT